MVASRRIGVIGALALIATAAGCSSAAAPVRTDATTVAKTTGATAAKPIPTRKFSAADCPSGSGLGRVAFPGRKSLRALDLDSCEVVTLVRHRVKGSIRWSADGRYIAFGNGAVIPSSGSPIRHPVGAVGGYHRWAWSLSGHRLAAIKRAGVVLGGPGMPARQLLPRRWGATDVLFGPDGTLAVSRAHRVRRFRYRQQLWMIDPSTGQRQRVWNRGGMEPSGPDLAEFSPGGGDVLFWPTFSASIDADGGSLETVPVTGGKPRVVTDSLMYRDYVANCDGEVVIAAGGWRESTTHKHLVAARAPDWKAHRLTSARQRSWVSPSCPSTGGFIAASAGPGPGNTFTRFGTERRSIWVLGPHGDDRRRLTFAADRNTTDESPRVSADGRTILFVRTTTPKHGQPTGKLFALSATDGAWGQPRLSGPIVRLAHGGNYYGHYGWTAVTDWYQPAG